MSVQQNEYLSIQQLYELAKKAIQAYPTYYHGEIKLLCQSENATFVVKTAQQQYALRIHRPNYHSKQQIESELAWLDALMRMASQCRLRLPTVMEIKSKHWHSTQTFQGMRYCSIGYKV